jgi:predicted amidohydrolase
MMGANMIRLGSLCAWVMTAGLLSAAGEIPFHQSAFSAEVAGPAGWEVWSHRPETAPHAYVDRVHSLGEPGSLAVGGAGNAAAHGGWVRRISGVRPGGWYAFSAYYRREGVAAENWQIVARLDWRNDEGRRTGQPDYAGWAVRRDGWTRLSLETQAPPGAASVRIELYLSNAPQGTVWWDDIALREIPDPGPRPVNVASVNLRPRDTGGPGESVAKFVEAVRESVGSEVDLILLPEGITVVGTAKSFLEVAEPIPGPTTRELGNLAREKNAYIVAGIYEREGETVYNTSVLIGRDGMVEGRYRKVYLPREEIEGGITPGNIYPVFDTDFGRIGMMICYDVFFPDPARALAARGAEIILMPIWGGPEPLAIARALENGVFLAASGYDHPTYIMDPEGQRVAEASATGGVAQATLDLNRRYVDPWLGEMRTRRLRELRVDIPLDTPGLRD